MHNDNISALFKAYEEKIDAGIFNKARDTILQATSTKHLFSQKLNTLLDIDISTFNNAVFHSLKNSNYPIAHLTDFSLVNNNDVIIKEDVINIFDEYGITYPKYYRELDYEVNGEIGKYARSRSGCFFCFYQQNLAI